MINLADASIRHIIVHKVGNKSLEESIQCSKKELELEEEIHEVLLDYFLSPFKSEEYYTFYHETDLAQNEVYSIVSELFENSSSFLIKSVQLANYLHENSNHPKINKGEFYVVYLENCYVDGEETDAIGLFKSELKESFLKVYPTEESFAIHCEEGINIKKLDKGCIILNKEKEKGYLVTTVDNLNKGVDAQYWKDEFLKIKIREDNFYHTQNVMSFCKSYVQDQLPEEYAVTKAEQAIILNKSVQFLKENESFDFNEFAQEVFEQPEIIQSVKDYKQNFERESDIHISDEFSISSQAIKKQARIMRSVIKLDKNFHIYVHGKRQYIQKGYDEEKGLNYYQIYFKEEN